MDTKTTAKDFFIWAGALISLYASVVSLIALIFDYINYAFPDPLSYYSNPYQSSLPYEMASLIVLAPVCLVLMRIIRRGMQADATRRDIWVRRWGLFLTVFLAGATVVIDLITLITNFLSGDETVAFLLKVAIVFLVAGAGFLHFLADLWGHWEKNPEKAKYINYAVGLLIIATVGSGFLIVGTPQQARQMRFDEQRVNDLQSIQSQVTYYYQAKQKLPTSLADLANSISGWNAPLDPKTQQPYEYATKGGLSFELCATFAQPSGAANPYASVPEPMGLGPSGQGFDTWQHAVGRTCFERSIDPAFYPPTNKPTF